MTESTLLRTRGLAVTVAGKSVCRDLDLSIRRGECWALLGRNGAGKTTLLHTLAGLRVSAAGSIDFAGRPLAEWSGRELARMRALLPQDDYDAFPASVLETALIGRHPHLSRWQWETPQDYAIARAALAAVDFAQAEARDVRTLSGGERRRVALAALLAQEPDLFLLDEPASHLDLAHQLALLERLTAIAREQGKALVMVLHDVNLAARYCDHTLLLDRGTAVAGAAAELLTSERLSALYGVALRSLRDDGRNLFIA
ncbi:MAG TPA: ABC transporter ATP-binding protein [Casimicrobiaceae bacterium]|nr:ABC transporter ATP-binding protein [Casimicrobiaceae bacterium]